MTTKPQPEPHVGSPREQGSVRTAAPGDSMSVLLLGDNEILGDLLSYLDLLDEACLGTIRIRVVPVNKHTGERVISDAAVPQFPLELLRPALQEAIRALVKENLCPR